MEILLEILKDQSVSDKLRCLPADLEIYKITKILFRFLVSHGTGINI